MYNITNQRVAAAVMRTTRTFRLLLDFDSFSVSGSDVGRATIEHTMSEDDTLSIGEVISRRAEIDLYTNRSIRKGDAFRLYLYLLDYTGDRTEPATHRSLAQWTHRELSMFTHREIALLGKTKDPDGAPIEQYYIPMGEYVVRSVKLSGSTTTVIGYDRLSAADAVYAPTIEFPADAGAVTEDVLRQLGISGRMSASSGNLLTSDAGEVLTADAGELLVSAEYSFAISDAPDGKTCREVLGAVAAMYGGNAILDREGRFTTAFMASAGAAFDPDCVDEPEIAAADVSVSGIRCYLSEGELAAGDPDGAHAVEFACPYMTQERLDAIWQELRRLRWRPAQVHERIADPRRDLGDLRYYTSARNGKVSIPIMGLIYHFDGGLSADITACGQTEETEVF